MIKKISSFLLLAMFCCQLMAQSDPWLTPTWAKNATIYEVNIRQYTKDGTFKAFERELPRLRAMGVDILWFMPIYPIGETGRKGTLGSYYAVKDYRGVNPEFGNMTDLRRLVQAAHKLGFKVILDWVANHSAPDNPLVNEHPDWYTHDSLGKIIPPVPDWSDVSDFNYDNKALREYQIESMKYWLRAADVDGFRCDVAMMVPLDFWKECRMQLDQVKRVFMLAEAEGPEFHRNGFDMVYGWDYMHLCNMIALGKQNGNDLKQYFLQIEKKYKSSDDIMYFTSNHDENTWNGTEFERLAEGARAFAVLSATIPGMPLIYTGQESALTRRLAFFDKDSISWGNYTLNDFYTKLMNLKQNHPAMFVDSSGHGDFTIITDKINPNHFVFTRKKGKDKVLVMINLSPKPTDFKVAKGEGEGDYTELFSGQEKHIKSGEILKMEGWGYKVFVK